MNKHYFACSLITVSVVIVSSAVISRKISKSYLTPFGNVAATANNNGTMAMAGLMGPSGYNPPRKPTRPKSGNQAPTIESIPPKPVPRLLCDADQHCDQAQYVVKVGTKELHFCGHHFQANIENFLMHGYEVKKLDK